MTTYAKVIDGSVVQWPYGMEDLKKDYPSTCFSSSVFQNESLKSQYNIVPVSKASPNPTAGYKAVHIGPVLESGSWTEKYENQEKSESELVDSDFINPNTPSDDILKDSHGTTIKTHEKEGVHKVNGNWEIIWGTVELGWKDKRLNAYGPPVDQIEHITENGLDSWVAKVNEIKGWYPKV
tara:strand:+ start:1388 stop:1927 length:540 start_codon:yes stop_codon:yes gene_type:complete